MPHLRASPRESRTKVPVMHSPSILLVIVPAMLVARASYGESESAKEQRAKTACMAGDYTEGVHLLSELFVATMHETYIFNQARCFEQNRRYEDAISRFQDYLRIGKNIKKANRVKALAHIEECKALLASEKAQSTPIVPPTPPQPVPPAPAPVAAKPKPPARQSNPPAARRSGSGLRVAGIVTAAVGGAALVGGVIFNVESNSTARDLKKTDGYTPGRDSDRKTYATLAWVGYGVGAACVATGTLLYVLGRHSAREPSVAFAPAVGPDHVGGVLKGTF
jgi:hypothetical protein